MNQTELGMSWQDMLIGRATTNKNASVALKLSVKH